jgi:hypothetical protein
VIRAIRGFYLLIWSGLASSRYNYLEMIFSCWELTAQIQEGGKRFALVDSLPLRCSLS